jgi:DNA-binding MarR family transcriptional regulator
MGLRGIDKARLSVRDIMVLFTIISRPGINGVECTQASGLENRSSLQSNIYRLIRRGLIEDRREQEHKGIPNMLYPLPAGIDLWNEIKPKGLT